MQKTLVSASSIEKDIKVKKEKMEKSNLIGEILAKRAKKKISVKYFLIEVRRHHGRVKAFAETLRKNGLKF